MDELITRGNHYFAYVDNEPTLILNCDSILGDPFERTVVLAFSQRLNSLSKLNPSKLNYFQTINEDIEVRYIRYNMIESLLRAYSETDPKKDLDSSALDENLAAFGAYYSSWKDLLGEKTLHVSEYDYFDGMKAYLTTKVRRLRDSEYDITKYIDGMTNGFGLYSKSREYEVMGLLWFLLAEDKGMDVFSNDDVRSDRYKLLLDGVPYTSVESLKDNQTISYDDYEAIYLEFQSELEDQVVAIRDQFKDSEPITLNLISESYSDTVVVDENTYMYLDYVARYDDNTLLTSNQQLVEMTPPYTIHYYIPETK